MRCCVVAYIAHICSALKINKLIKKKMALFTLICVVTTTTHANILTDTTFRVNNSF